MGAICDSTLDMFQWLCEIGDAIRFQDLAVWVGFAYLTHGKPSDQGVERQYIWAAQELSLEKTKLYEKSQWDEFARRFKNRSHGSILQDIAQSHVNPFTGSGFNPYKLVMAYIWIR